LLALGFKTGPRLRLTRSTRSGLLMLASGLMGLHSHCSGDKKQDSGGGRQRARRPRWKTGRRTHEVERCLAAELDHPLTGIGVDRLVRETFELQVISKRATREVRVALTARGHHPSHVRA